MIKLLAKSRKIVGKKVKTLRKEGLLPAVLYGPGIESKPLQIEFKEFEKTYKESGENTLIDLEVAQDKKYLVLIHNVKNDPLTGNPLHADLYQPALDKRTETEIPIILEGEAPAVKTLGGTLIKNIAEIKVRALPQKLPKEFRVDINNLKTFDDHILIKDLKTSADVEILRELNEIVAQVMPPENIEEELAKPIEEKVEEVEKIEKRKEEKEEKSTATENI